MKLFPTNGVLIVRHYRIAKVKLCLVDKAFDVVQNDLDHPVINAAVGVNNVGKSTDSKGGL